MAGHDQRRKYFWIERVDPGHYNHAVKFMVCTRRFDHFFAAATETSPPYPYQCRLACGPGADPSKPETLARTTVCRSQLIRIPTGLGKTAAVVLAWLWNRMASTSAPQQRPESAPLAWPRRLVYCLPMRALVEQTANNVRTWLRNLWQQRESLGLSEAAQAELLWLAGDGSAEHPAHSPVILLGGEELDPARSDWDLYPEKPAILIDTQDMLLSRALNRGYGMSRYRWPMHFALLNNDCLWVMDETQLMGVALETSAQLDAFRSSADAVVNTCPTWWMSATLDETRLSTVDHPPPASGWPTVELDPTDQARSQVAALLRAPKPLYKAQVTLSPATAKTYARALAEFVLSSHQPGSLTLVILNRVPRAQEVFLELRKLKPRDPVGLIHSRFRPVDRHKHHELLHADGGRIVIATQALEAGVDVSARTLITELAPWPSLVQRFGRCNRRGEFTSDQARILWIDLQPKDARDELALPYTSEELDAARRQLEALTAGDPVSLQSVQVAELPSVRPVLRRKDLWELFDTTPDLAGYDLDIARFIRDGDDTDVQVYWRDLAGQPPSPNEPEPVGEELCPVSIASFRSFLTKLEKAGRHQLWPVWHWNPLTEQWEEAHRARAGAIYLLDIAAGGYSADLGWFGDAKHAANVTPCPRQAAGADGYGRDPASQTGVWVTLADHTRHVVDETNVLARALATELAQLNLQSPPATVLETAARWHDLGKAHEAFQRMLCGEDETRARQLWAKSAERGRSCPRRYFRHELASALAWLEAGSSRDPERNLVAYLIAAHHGKVRLSIRSLPGEEPPDDQPQARIARGIIDGDELPAEGFVAIGVNPPPGPVRLSLELMEMGRGSNGEPSWLARMVALRERLGPFRLAWLETLLRVADIRASIKEAPAQIQL